MAFHSKINTSVTAKISYCDMHAVGLRNRRFLVTARQATEEVDNVKAAFSMWSDPRLYNQGKRKAVFGDRMLARPAANLLY
jgi:hypothetical protein